MFELPYGCIALALLSQSWKRHRGMGGTNSMGGGAWEGWLITLLLTHGVDLFSCAAVKGAQSWRWDYSQVRDF